MAAISTRDVGLRLEIMWCTIFLRLNPNDEAPTYVIVTYADSVSLQSVRLEGNTSASICRFSTVRLIYAWSRLPETVCVSLTHNKLREKMKICRRN